MQAVWLVSSNEKLSRSSRQVVGFAMRQMVINSSIDRLLKGFEDADPNNGEMQGEKRDVAELKSSQPLSRRDQVRLQSGFEAQS